jgi:hypothetical protein
MKKKKTSNEVNKKHLKKRAKEMDRKNRQIKREERGQEQSGLKMNAYQQEIRNHYAA